eukprot:m.64466 g.64466  ORF g.64466 m.64466 type:complete len:207 (+) comp13592_c0_seq1:49-669(+)
MSLAGLVGRAPGVALRGLAATCPLPVLSRRAVHQLQPRLTAPRCAWSCQHQRHSSHEYPRPSFEPRIAHYEQRVRNSFADQPAMKTIGATITEVSPGQVSVLLPLATHLGQQNGFLHAGVVSTALDSACGYAAYSLMDAVSAVLTAEFKISLCSPANGDLLCVGTVVKPGRTLSFVEGRAINKDTGKLVATMTATIMAVRRPELNV